MNDGRIRFLLDAIDISVHAISLKAGPDHSFHQHTDSFRGPDVKIDHSEIDAPMIGSLYRADYQGDGSARYVFLFIDPLDESAIDHLEVKWQTQ